MTATATIQVAYVNQPTQPGKKGSIKTATQDFYLVKKPIDLAKFEQGKFYDVEYDEFSFKDGGAGKSITKVTPRAPERPTVVEGASAPAPRSIPISEDREFEFVTRVLCARVSIGGMTPKDLVDGGVMLRQAYAAIFGTGARA